MKRNIVEVKKDDKKVKTMVFVNGICIEERSYDFEPKSVIVCLSCAEENEADQDCVCGGRNITYLEYMRTADFGY